MRRALLALALLGCGCGPAGPTPAEKASLCLGNLQSMWEPMEFYMTDHQGQYPPRLEALSSSSPSTGKPYLARVPDCPPGWSYVYEVQPGTIGSYTLICRSLTLAQGLTPDYPRMTSRSRPVAQP